jgi:hypothetical protein
MEEITELRGSVYPRGTAWAGIRGTPVSPEPPDSFLEALRGNAAATPHPEEQAYWPVSVGPWGPRL